MALEAGVAEKKTLLLTVLLLLVTVAAAQVAETRAAPLLRRVLRIRRLYM